MEERFDLFQKTLENIQALETELKRMDSHYENVCKAML